MTTPEFPHPCSRCGMCCQMEPCLFARVAYEQQEGECPALHRDDVDNAVCLLSQRFLARGMGETFVNAIFGFGNGCCISAQALNAATGERTDFAALPPEMKRHMSRSAQIVRRKKKLQLIALEGGR